MVLTTLPSAAEVQMRAWPAYKEEERCVATVSAGHATLHHIQAFRRHSGGNHEGSTSLASKSSIADVRWYVRLLPFPSPAKLSIRCPSFPSRSRRLLRGDGTPMAGPPCVSHRPLHGIQSVANGALG